MRTRLLAAAIIAATALPILVAVPVAAGDPPRAAYAVVRDPGNEAGYIVEGKDVYNSAIGRITARNTEPGSVEVRISTWTTNQVNVLVTPLTTKPRACVVGGWSPEATHTTVWIDCYDKNGVPTNTPFIVTARVLYQGQGQFGYLHANQPGLPGYIPTAIAQSNGAQVGPVNAVVRVDEGLWDARLPGLGASGGTVQVAAEGGIGPRCGAVSWKDDGDDKVVRVRCRSMAGDPADEEFILWYAKGQGLASQIDRKQAYLFAHRPKAASYTPKLRFSTEGGTPTVVRNAKGRWTVTLPTMPKGGAAHVTPIGDGSVRCNVSSIRKNTLPQKIGVRCWNPAGQPANAKFTLAYVR
jgi:hypothetical protein